MRALAIVFVVLLAALQYPMWLGKGGWLQVREIDRQLAAQREGNTRLKARNDALDADVRDLKTGFDAIEERARSELGMVKQDEVFFQIQQRPEQAADAQPAPAAGSSGETATLPIRPATRAASRR